MRPGSKEHSCVLAGDMLIATDINLKNISRSNMCLRLHLQPSEKRGTARAHTHTHTLTHTQTNTHSEGKVGQVKQANVFQRQPAICDVLKKQLIEQLVETLRLKFESFGVVLNTRRIILLNKCVLCFSTAPLKYWMLLIKRHTKKLLRRRLNLRLWVPSFVF